MQKTKIISGLIMSVVAVFAMVTNAKAATVVQIQTLPGYINKVDFKLSCTTNGSTAQFYSRKDGGGNTNFGPVINLNSDPCQIQVNNNQFGSEGTFTFGVIVDGTYSSETTTTLDTTPPGSISDFGKQRIGGGTVYHLTWKNPTDSDYQRVFIYRGTTLGFESDGNKIAEAGGSPGDSMTYDDGSLDPGKEYYYYIRAVDKAGNASGLVGDQGETTTVTTTPAPGTGTSRSVVTLPKTQGQGSILGTEATPEPTMEAPTGVVNKINAFANTTPEPFKWILTHKKISLGLLIILGLLGYYLYRARKLK